MAWQYSRRAAVLQPRFLRPSFPRIAALLTASLLSPLAVRGGEWPQILGPHRNGQADNETIAAAFPSQGPPVVWQRDVGAGNAGVAVAQGRAILFHHPKDADVVESLDAATGAVKWTNSFANRSEGPACTPLIDGQRIFLVGNDGGLRCVAFDTGKVLWSRDLLKEFHAPAGYFGVGSSPVVEGDNLLMNVGGDSGAGIVAFALKDGTTVWKTGNEQASYSSPVVVGPKQARQAIFVTRLNLISLDPATGQVQFTFPFGKRGPTVNAATPIVVDDHLFLTANYGIGAVWAKFTGTSAKTIWENDDSLSSQYPTPVFFDGYLYGVHGRDDVGVAELRCIDPTDGKMQWAERDFGMATLLIADKKLLIQRTDGELIIAEPSPKAYRPLAKAKLLDGLTRALPALCDGKYYVRDTKTLKCVDLSPTK
jgi:outer membrane protein assembly factor BamB